MIWENWSQLINLSTIQHKRKEPALNHPWGQGG